MKEFARASLPPDRYFIEDSLGALEDNLAFLVEVSGRPRDEFVGSREACYSAAYALMICIESVAGIAAHLIASTTSSKPGGMASSFEVLRAEGILTSDQLVSNLVQMSRFRNLIVHRYWKVDYETVYNILKDHLEDFREFAQQVLEYADREGL